MGWRVVRYLAMDLGAEDLRLSWRDWLALGIFLGLLAVLWFFYGAAS
jgi:hypothetical protein